MSPGEKIVNAEVTEDELKVELLDGRTVTAAPAWYPRPAPCQPGAAGELEDRRWRIRPPLARCGRGSEFGGIAPRGTRPQTSDPRLTRPCSGPGRSRVSSCGRVAGAKPINLRSFPVWPGQSLRAPEGRTCGPGHAFRGTKTLPRPHQKARQTGLTRGCSGSLRGPLSLALAAVATTRGPIRNPAGVSAGPTASRRSRWP